MQNLLLSDRIKKRCKDLNLTIKSLLEKSNMNRNTIYDLEKKGVFPSSDKLSRMANYLNCSTDYLLGRTDIISGHTIHKPGSFPRIVAYLDILGATKFFDIYSHEEIVTEFENICYRIFHRVIDESNDIFFQHNYDEIDMKMFSDNIIICIHYTEENYPTQLATIIDFVAFLQFMVFHQLNISLRGGIVCGILELNEDFVIGKPLIEAYNLEDKKAIYPRTVISDEIIMSLDNKQQYKIAQDKDGMYYVNYFETINLSKSLNIDTNNYINTLLYNLELDVKGETNPRILEKYLWIYDKLHDFCEQKGLTNLMPPPSGRIRKAKAICQAAPKDTVNIPYNNLNSLGKAKADDYVETLSENPKYTQQSKSNKAISDVDTATDITPTMADIKADKN